MSQCNFCREEFRNSQAVRAHLRKCANYQESKKANATRLQSIDSSRSSSKSIHQGSLAPNETVMPANPFVSFVDQFTRQFAATDEATRLRQKRESLLAGVWTTLVDWHRPPEGVVTPEMAVAAKVAIMDELGALAIHELPQTELTLRGTAIRNRIFGPYLRRQQEQVKRQDEKQQQEGLRRQQDTDTRARRTTRKTALIELGITRALQSAPSRGIAGRALVVLEWEVRARLETWLVGDEMESQVDETIEAAIERPLLEWEARVEQYQSAKRQRILDHCLMLALPVVEAAMPWVKEVVVKTICETLGMPPPPLSPQREASASSTNEAAHETPDTPTPRPVRRRRVHPASPTTDRGEASASGEPAPSASSEKWTATS